jgi:uncharacterized damage-inducible protein DinB
MSLVDPLMAELENESKTTRKVLDRVPGDKLGWKPHAKSMSLGQLALHIAQVPGNIAGFVSVPVFERPANAPFAQKEAASKSEIMTTLDASLAKAKDVLRGLDDATIMSMWSFKMGDKTLMTMPRIAVVRNIMLNHWYHHRGQLSVYLRELDVPVPSIYGPSADENPFA